jgi:hypothetical protein
MEASDSDTWFVPYFFLIFPVILDLLYQNFDESSEIIFIMTTYNM